MLLGESRKRRCWLPGGALDETPTRSPVHTVTDNAWKRRIRAGVIRLMFVVIASEIPVIATYGWRASIWCDVILFGLFILAAAL